MTQHRKYQPTPARGCECPPASLCSNLLCESNVSALSNDLLHTLHTYCLVDLFVFEDIDALTGITNNK